MSKSHDRETLTDRRIFRDTQAGFNPDKHQLVLTRRAADQLRTSGCMGIQEQAEEWDLKRILVPLLLGARMERQEETSRGSALIVRGSDRLGRMPGTEFEFTLVFGMDRRGTPLVAHDGKRRMAYLTDCKVVRT